jgi:hypothetical protein
MFSLRPRTRASDCVLAVQAIDLPAARLAGQPGLAGVLRQGGRKAMWAGVRGWGVRELASN